MSKPSVPLAHVKRALQKRWGSFSGLQALASGLTSQVFSFHSGDAEYVIRISDSPYSFQKDAFVSDSFASPSLPIPKVVKLGRLDAETHFCISLRASGVPLQALTTSEFVGVTNAVINVMNAINKANLIGTRGFGRFDAQGQAPHKTWAAFLLTVTDAQIFDWSGKVGQGDKSVVSRATSTVRELVQACPELRCLLHGDFGSYNVLSDGERVTGVIDWDLGLLGDPLYDVANLFFWQEEQMLPLIEQLENGREHLPQWQERVLCYQLHIGLNEIYYERYDACWLIDRCKAIMDL